MSTSSRRRWQKKTRFEGETIVAEMASHPSRIFLRWVFLLSGAEITGRAPGTIVTGTGRTENPSKFALCLDKRIREIATRTDHGLSIQSAALLRQRHTVFRYSTFAKQSCNVLSQSPVHFCQYRKENCKLYCPHLTRIDRLSAPRIFFHVFQFRCSIFILYTNIASIDFNSFATIRMSSS